jgi:hypothetical protein
MFVLDFSWTKLSILLCTDYIIISLYISTFLLCKSASELQLIFLFIFLQGLRMRTIINLFFMVKISIFKFFKKIVDSIWKLFLKFSLIHSKSIHKLKSLFQKLLSMFFDFISITTVNFLLWIIKLNLKDFIMIFKG